MYNKKIYNNFSIIKTSKYRIDNNILNSLILSHKIRYLQNNLELITRCLIWSVWILTQWQ